MSALARLVCRRRGHDWVRPFLFQTAMRATVGLGPRYRCRRCGDVGYGS